MILLSIVLYAAGLTLENELIVRNAIRKEPICSGKRKIVHNTMLS